MKYGRKFGEGIAGSLGSNIDEMSKSVAQSRLHAKQVPNNAKDRQAEFLTKVVTDGKFDAKDLATNTSLKREWVGTLRDM